MKNSPLLYRLQGLRKQQVSLGRRLDRAYASNNMTDYLTLEAKHQRIALIIDRLLPKLEASSRTEPKT